MVIPVINTILIGLFVGACGLVWLTDSSSAVTAIIFGFWYFGLCLIDIKRDVKSTRQLYNMKHNSLMILNIIVWFFMFYVIAYFHNVWSLIGSFIGLLAWQFITGAIKE